MIDYYKILSDKSTLIGTVIVIPVIVTMNEIKINNIPSLPTLLVTVSDSYM